LLALAHGTSFDDANREGGKSATDRHPPEGLPLIVQIAASPWREGVASILAAHL